MIPKRARGPNRNLMEVPISTLLNKGERINVGGVVGHIERRIVLNLHKQPLTTLIPANLILVIRRMGMM